MPSDAGKCVHHKVAHAVRLGEGGSVAVHAQLHPGGVVENLAHVERQQVNEAHHQLRSHTEREEAVAAVAS
eukprot:3598804-Rhodomonas_salina.1